VRATVLEKRVEYSRNNLLHVWHSSIRDLKNIGAKYFYPQFCTGGIKCALLPPTPHTRLLCHVRTQCTVLT
jgi:hypothetical protein